MQLGFIQLALDPDLLMPLCEHAVGVPCLSQSLSGPTSPDAGRGALRLGDQLVHSSCLQHLSHIRPDRVHSDSSHATAMHSDEHWYLRRLSHAERGLMAAAPGTNQTFVNTYSPFLPACDPTNYLDDAQLPPEKFWNCADISIRQAMLCQEAYRLGQHTGIAFITAARLEVCLDCMF